MIAWHFLFYLVFFTNSFKLDSWCLVNGHLQIVIMSFPT